jgi:hypothetical protein
MLPLSFHLKGVNSVTVCLPLQDRLPNAKPINQEMKMYAPANPANPEYILEFEKRRYRT